VTLKIRGVPPCGVTAMVAVRVFVLVLAAAAQLIVASAVPDVAVVMVSHDALLAAFHCNVLLFVEIENDPVSPAADAIPVKGKIVSTDGAWVTVSTSPVPLAGVTVMVAVRVDAVGLPVALNWKVPFPVPVAPWVIVSHESLDAAVQVSAWFVEVTRIVPFEMEAGAITLPGIRVIVPVITPAAWLMVDVCAGTPVGVTVPLVGVTEIVEERLALIVFAAALHWIWPAPVPW
jgi:hypothetical protein